MVGFLSQFGAGHLNVGGIGIVGYSLYMCVRRLLWVVYALVGGIVGEPCCVEWWRWGWLTHLCVGGTEAAFVALAAECVVQSSVAGACASADARGQLALFCTWALVGPYGGCSTRNG